MLLLRNGGFFSSSLLIIQFLSSTTSARFFNSPRLWPFDRRLSNRHAAVMSAATAFPSYRTWENDAESALDLGNLNCLRTPVFSSWTAALPRLPTFLRRRSTESTLQAVTDAFAACGGISVSVYESKYVLLIKNDSSYLTYVRNLSLCAGSSKSRVPGSSLRTDRLLKACESWLVVQRSIGGSMRPVSV